MTTLKNMLSLNCECAHYVDDCPCCQALEHILKLEAALKPFAAEYRTFDCVMVDGVEMLPDDHGLGIIGEWPPMHSPIEAEFRFGDLRRAHELVGDELELHGKR